VKRYIIILSSLLLIFNSAACQEKKDSGSKILFNGLVIDASTFAPIPNSQIYINRSMTAVSGPDGSFTFYVNPADTIVFNSLGYKSSIYHVSDTLKGFEFNAGIYMKTDTLEIGEVIIIPKQRNLKSEIMNSPSRNAEIINNARNNIAVSAYQGRTSQAQLGDPVNNYAVISQKQKTMAFEKGGIPSEQTLAISPFLLLPAAYLLVKGFPEKPQSVKPPISPFEVDQIHRKYLETHKVRNK
jgi:hypothetical protein